MLPTGHIAGGYLFTKAVLKILPNNLSDQRKEQLARLGAVLGFLPDIDVFYAFYKSAALTINHSVANHRLYLTHTPLIWLVLGLVISFLFWKKPFWKHFGLIVWVGAWSHMLLDSIDYGVRWLWPISEKTYALISGNIGVSAQANNFFSYWFGFLTVYSLTPTFYIELIIIISAIWVFFKSNKPTLF